LEEKANNPLTPNALVIRVLGRYEYSPGFQGQSAMQNQSLDRIRNDLDVIHDALGGPTYGPADVQFLAAISLAAAACAIGIALGADAGWRLGLAGLPLVVIGVAYATYSAIKSRNDSNATSIQRKEYRTSLLVIVPAAIAAYAAKEWAIHAGMSQLQFAGALAMVTGALLVVLSATNSTHRRYPTAMWYCVGVPLIVCGLILPACSLVQAWIAVATMGSVIAGALSWLYQRDLTQRNRGQSHAAN
jgi:hypothetical protein